jgi:uncharacterized protein (TIGR02145 family)
MWNFKRDIYRTKSGCTPSCTPWVYTYGPWSAWSSCVNRSRTRTRTIDGTRTCILDDCSTVIETSSTIDMETSYCCIACTAPNVTIGGQLWTACNADVSTFRDGSPILEVTSANQWNAAAATNTPAYCYYNFDGPTHAKYGKLYNWHAVNDPRGLAPIGWHVPSRTEWETLVAFIGGSMQGGTLKSTDPFPCGFASPNQGATNSTGLSLLPGGYMNQGSTVHLGMMAEYWTSTWEAPGSNRAFDVSLNYNSAQIIVYAGNMMFMDNGLSVRFVHD